MENVIENTKQKPLKIRTELLAFLDKAKKYRANSQYYFMQDGFLFTTDGRRAHRIKASEFHSETPLEDGCAYNFYVEEKEKLFSKVIFIKQDGITPPALNNIWPKELPEVMTAVSVIINKDSLNLTSLIIKIFYYTGRALNIDFIKDLGYEKKFTNYKVYGSAKADHPLVFEAEKGNVQALILGFRCELVNKGE